MQYELRHGDVWNGQHHVADGSGLMGVVIDNEYHNILTHGNAKRVGAKFDRYKVSGLYDAVEALYFPVHPEILRVLNHCINCTGSAKRFKTFLKKFGAEHPELIPNELAIADAFA